MYPEKKELPCLVCHGTKKTIRVGVNFPQEKADPSKRGILSKVARIYDPPGLASPISLGDKLLYRDVCDAKLNWDAELPRELMQSWIRWEERLPDSLQSRGP